MELSALLTLSPTLLEERLQLTTNDILQGMSMYNAPKVMGTLVLWNKETGEKYQVHFTDLPEEIRKGIHDYTTRLCSERLLIETALNKE